MILSSITVRRAGRRVRYGAGSKLLMDIPVRGTNRLGRSSNPRTPPNRSARQPSTIWTREAGRPGAGGGLEAGSPGARPTATIPNRVFSGRALNLAGRAAGEHGGRGFARASLC